MKLITNITILGSNEGVTDMTMTEGEFKTYTFMYMTFINDPNNYSHGDGEFTEELKNKVETIILKGIGVAHDMKRLFEIFEEKPAPAENATVAKVAEEEGEQLREEENLERRATVESIKAAQAAQAAAPKPAAASPPSALIPSIEFSLSSIRRTLSKKFENETAKSLDEIVKKAETEIEKIEKYISELSMHGQDSPIVVKFKEELESVRAQVNAARRKLAEKKQLEKTKINPEVAAAALQAMQTAPKGKEVEAFMKAKEEKEREIASRPNPPSSSTVTPGVSWASKTRGKTRKPRRKTRKIERRRQEF
jgi:hypothetical protein